MKKLLFVMNPYAGMRRANRFLADILSLFNAHGYEVTVHMTAGPGDGARAVEAMAGHGDLVVCAGGDGTFNETVTELLRSGVDVPVGYIPCGSTNDFANSLKLPTNVLQAAQAILDGDPVPYDVGRFGDRYFSYVASFWSLYQSLLLHPPEREKCPGACGVCAPGSQGAVSNSKRACGVRHGQWQL
ncbi:MAG: diacylglycerol/lipid kinase family protein [Oscillospiraceae bacterium]